MIGSVDLSEHTDWYEALKKSVLNNDNKKLKEYLIFDDDNKVAWIIWGTNI